MLKKRKKRYNKHKKTPVQWLILIAKIGSFLMALWLITWGVLKFNQSVFLNAEIQWHIDQTLPISQANLARKIQPFIQGKYRLDLHPIKQVLEREPWIDGVQIKRLFWNNIQINIVAKRIAMRWENIDCQSEKLLSCRGYINTDGALFLPEKMLESKAVLARSKLEVLAVQKLYKSYQRYQLLSKPMIIKTLQKTNIDQLVFTSGVKVILGNQQQEKQLIRFIKAYKKLKKHNKKITRATFDMRYPRGFALSY